MMTRRVLFFVACLTIASPAAPTVGEPTNAAEAAAQKARSDAELDAAYQGWVAGLSPAAQAWERVLQDQLGSSSTTPIPDDPAKRQSAASIVERNAAAASLMAKHGIAVNDLFTAITPRLAELQNPNDVHFSNAGYAFLGARVAEAVVAK